MSTDTGNISRQFVDFFKARQKLFLESKKNVRLNQPIGWFEELRTETFGTPNIGDISVKEVTDWSKLNAKIYTIHSIGQISVVLAYYEDGTIFWLDDHSSDEDFEAFVRKERIWAWLPAQKENLVSLLIETKLNYLGRPQLINNISDIPSFTKQDLELWAEDPHAQSELIESQQKLKSVSEKITPPNNVLVKYESVFELTFFVWTKIMGKIVHAQFEFGQDGLFRYQGTEIVKLVGRFLVPR